MVGMYAYAGEGDMLAVFFENRVSGGRLWEQFGDMSRVV